MSDSRSTPQRHRSLAQKLVLLTALMFGFGYALVPLYDVFCDITGLNGKTGVAQARHLAQEVDTTRLIKVQFLGEANSTLPWDIEPEVMEMAVHPGQVYETTYFAKNRSIKANVGQAVPSVSPNIASLYFKKTECFCFTNQPFDAGEGRAMSVRFLIARDLPVDVRTVTLSYTFYKVS